MIRYGILAADNVDSYNSLPGVESQRKPVEFGGNQHDVRSRAVLTSARSHRRSGRGQSIGHQLELATAQAA